MTLPQWQPSTQTLGHGWAEGGPEAESLFLAVISVWLYRCRPPLKRPLQDNVGMPTLTAMSLA